MAEAFTPLRPGDPVGVVAPSGHPDPEALSRGLELLGERYQVRTFGELIRPRAGMFAGDDRLRAEELRWALSSGELRCVIAARGGYGTARLLEGVADILRRGSPPLVVGFSDLTALLSAILELSGRRAVHGPMVCQLGRRGKAALAPLVSLLERPGPPPPFEGLEGLTPGRARGPLVGGNLTVLTHLVGTPYFPNLSGALLFLEDVGERPYRLDRCLLHLRQAGALSGLAGLVVGDLTDCEAQGGEAPAAEVLERFALSLKLPLATGLPAGHGPRNLPLPLGAEAELDADRGTLTFLEGVVV